MIHIPTLVICLGCVLTASFGHRGWGTLVCREWAVLSMSLTSVWGLFRVLGNKRMTLCEDDVAKTFFLIEYYDSDGYGSIDPKEVEGVVYDHK